MNLPSRYSKDISAPIRPNNKGWKNSHTIDMALDTGNCQNIHMFNIFIENQG
jgi:hypothetical protein